MRLPGRHRRPPRPPRPDPLAPGGKVHWSRGHAAWRTTASQQCGLYHWTYGPDVHAWTRGDKVPTMGATREQTWALRRDELLREQNRLLAEQNRLLAGLAPTPPEPTVLPASGPRRDAEGRLTARLPSRSSTPRSCDSCGPSCAPAPRWQATARRSARPGAPGHLFAVLRKSAARRLCVEGAVLVREDDGLHAVVEPELREDARDIRLDRCVGDDEVGGDLGGRRLAGE